MTLSNWNFHFIAHADTGQPYEFNLLGLDKISYKPNYWVNFTNPTVKFTCDGYNFTFLKPTYSAKGMKRYAFTPSCPDFELSAFIDSSYTRMMSVVSQYGDKVTYEPMASGLVMPVVRFGNEDKSALCVAMVSRQHSTEMYQDWYMEGILQQIAMENFTNTSYILFPMANPDGVFNTTYHLNIAGQDLNDCWDTLDCQEVSMIRKDLDAFNQSCGRIDVAFDWHGGNTDPRYTKDTILYTTPKEKELAMAIRYPANFLAISRFTDTPEKLANYYRRSYNATTLTMEIQMPTDANHTPEEMVFLGSQAFKAMKAYYNITEVSRTMPENISLNITANATEPPQNASIDLTAIKEELDRLNMTIIAQQAELERLNSLILNMGG